MKGFAVGFLLASVLWGGLASAYLTGALDGLLPEEEVAAPPDGGPVAEAVHEEVPAKRRKGRRWRRRRGKRGDWRPGKVRGSGPIVESGDDLGEGEARELDLGEGSGGEQRLSSAQIDAAFGPAMPGIRRCLLMLDPDQEGSGRVVFGLRVSGAGRVVAARLQGPSALTTGAVGQCLTRSARAIRFPTFDGPEMVVRYPITFE